MITKTSTQKIEEGVTNRNKWLVVVLGAVVSLLLILFIGFIVWKVPQLQVAGSALLLTPNQVLERENQARANLIQLLSTFAQVIGGVVLLIGLYFTWRNIKLTERTATNTLEIAEHTLTNSQAAQITERFTKAIEQLGKSDEDGKDANLAIRLGGIYSLERIAKDSPKDHWPIVEILTTYIREKVPWVEQNKHILDPRPSTEIQTILNVLSRRSLTYKQGEEQQLNLKRLDLRRAQMERTNLSGARLAESHLQEADLSNSILENADLTEAHLEGADLTGATLRDADLSGAYLDGAILIGADLRGAHLEGGSLLNANLHRAKLNGAHLEGANLSTAINLTEAQVTSARSAKALLPEGLKSIENSKDSV
jgi:hypothetical protein